MADQSFSFNHNSPEHVAYKLFRDVARAEGKLDSYGTSIANADRKWILDTYRECLDAVTNRVSKVVIEAADSKL